MANKALKICNLEYLFDLSKGDMGFVQEMIDVFLQDNSGELDNLEKKIAEKNFPEIRQISHKLRSSIPYMGLDILIGEEVMEIEDLASKGGNIKKITTLFKKVRKVCDEAIAELKELKF